MRKTALLFLLLTAARAFAQPAPDGFIELLNTQETPGRIIRLHGFHQSQPDAAWTSQIGVRMRHVALYDDIGCHRLEYTLDHAIRGIWSERRVPIKPNRRYTVSALIRSDFDRADVEINLGLRPFDPETNYPLPGSREAGVPAKTNGPDGWERWSWSFVTPSIEDLPDAAFTLWVYVNEREAGAPPLVDGTRVPFEIADLRAIEHPVTEPKPFPPGEGVTFRGGPGALPMRVESAKRVGENFEVVVTGARYTFTNGYGTIEAHQRIGRERLLARFDVPRALDGLRIHSVSETEAVLVSDRMTIGVQCDGVLVMTAHDGAGLTTIMQSHLKAPFTRFARGHLLAKDDAGGFTVNPLPVVGSGRLPVAQMLKPDADFHAFDEGDTESLSDEFAPQPGLWSMQPGDRLFISVFPPRPYDWERSFKDIWFWTFRDSPIASYETNRPWVTSWGLWDFSQRAWAMSHSDEYTPISEDRLRAHIARIHAQGDVAFPYMSAWFHRTRDPEVFVGEVARWMDEYDIDGIYSDGLPAVEWLVAYEEMRMLRELVHDGPLVIHDSVPQSGRSISMFQPFLYTYATHTYMGEHVESNTGAHWAWARHALSQHVASNCFGDIKGDRWNDASGNPLGVRKDLANLVLNGRSSPGTIGYVERYLPALAELERLWQDHHEDAADYYNQYHLPHARRITGIEVGRAGAPIIERTPAENGRVRVAIRTNEDENAVIRYTTDGGRPGSTSTRYDGPFEVHASAVILARTFHPSREHSVIIESSP